MIRLKAGNQETMQMAADQVKLLGLGLSDEQTTPNLICPNCDGGQSKEKSFSITRKKNLLVYNCFRASCGFKGAISSFRRGTEAKQEKPPLYFKASLEALHAFQRVFLINHFNLRREEVDLNFKWCERLQRIVSDIRNHDGDRIGCISRDYKGCYTGGINAGGPKTLSYHENKEFPWGHFNEPYISGERILIVEDYVSALKAGRHINTLALLGSHVSDELVEHLVHIGVKEVLLALDADAFKKALVFKNRFSLAFGNFSVVGLSKDIKDMTGYEFSDAMKPFGVNVYSVT